MKWYLHHLSAGYTVYVMREGWGLWYLPNSLHSGVRAAHGKHQADKNEPTNELFVLVDLTENVFGWPAVVSH